ncbi:transposase [Ochrobactrum sp. SFR4]|uniref:transposase n=1 Tax=Ochrobactrum sp. SFR4 TaxID=2717368 RepID=UPI001C8CD70D|nr:transposase [Ochrobactrum sp. SFR4]MBX8827373.1 transposase [Ochrobactrum sp. SFR4]
MTITAAGFLMLLTSVPANEMTASDVLDMYRLRWQGEIAFKRLKSGLGIHKLPAKDPQLARSWLMAHLIIALIIDEAVTDVLDSPPCEDETPLRDFILVEAS